MHRNENKYDQLFRNRLRDLSHPVRSELWSRIQSGIGVRKAPVPNPGTRLPFLQSAVRSGGIFSKGFFSAARLAMAAAAALTITLGIIHFTRTATPPSAHPVNRYSTITPATTPAGSTAKSSITTPDSSRDRHGESATPDATLTKTNPSSDNTATADIRRNHLTERDRIASANPDDDAHSTSVVTETMPGTLSVGKPAATSIQRHLRHPVTLPAMATTSIRADITARSPGSKSPHNGSGSPGKKAGNTHFQRTGYVSLYASPDFPNHYYTWSYTLGARLTFQFSRRWSFTAGFEYARVNVPTQVVPPINSSDTLHSFHFSNYEVPVLFGYTTSFRRSTLTVNGGAIINLYFHRSTGAWVFNWPDRDSYGAVLGVDYSYSLDRHLALFAQPYGRFSISDYRMFIPAQRLSFGTLLGIKYEL